MSTLPTIIPKEEVDRLINIVVQSFEYYTRIKIDSSTLQSTFIDPRPQTRFGFELTTISETTLFKIRFYGVNFVPAPIVNEFRLEQLMDYPNGLGDEVHVSVSDLPLDGFPILSKALNPIIDPESLNVILTEDSLDFWQTEDGKPIHLEG